MENIKMYQFIESNITMIINVLYFNKYLLNSFAQGFADARLHVC